MACCEDGTSDEVLDALRKTLGERNVCVFPTVGVRVE